MKVFATRVWGFAPSIWPVITFGLEGNRDWLLQNSSPGDRIVFVGTQDVPTSENERGKLLGMAEIGRRAVDTLDVISADIRNPHNYDEQGNFKWPKGILMIKAWKFNPQPLLLDVLQSQLPFSATPRAVELSPVDTSAVLHLPVAVQALPSSQALDKARMLDAALANNRQTTGPRPVNWEGETGRNVERTAYTYACRFGRSNIWKVGHAVDYALRVVEFNRHIPAEVVPERWMMVLDRKWTTEIEAYDMEQRILKHLASRRTEGERLRCNEDELMSAWLAAIGI